MPALCSGCGALIGSGLDAQGLCPACLFTMAARMTPSVFDEGPARIGARIGSYDIIAMLGKGRRGVVYQASDISCRRIVALKVMNDVGTGELRSGLLREARLASRLAHPNICATHEAIDVEGVVCIAMEYVGGQSLTELIPIRGLSGEAALAYGRQIVEAVAHAHAQRIVHGDLKSARVMITREGGVKVLGFGFARQVSIEPVDSAASPREAGTGAVFHLGTAAYAAPETLRGEPADARTDVWALGVMLYEMVTGALPFRGRTPLELASAVLHDAPPPLPARVPSGLAAAIARCLTKDPATRYQEAADLRVML